jgi:GTPase
VVEIDLDTRFVVADVPGLIEGASAGAGLGDRFLRHVERTRVLACLIDVTSENPAADLQTLREELRRHGRGLERKPAIVVLSKADLLPPDARAGTPARVALPEAKLLSSHSGEGVRDLLDTLWQKAMATCEAGDHGG